MAGDGTPLAFLFCLAVRDKWGALRAASDSERPFSARPRAGPVDPPADRPLDPRSSEAAFSERRGGKALQCAAAASVSRGPLRAVSAHRPCGSSDVAALDAAY